MILEYCIFLYNLQLKADFFFLFFFFNGGYDYTKRC